MFKYKVLDEVIKKLNKMKLNKKFVYKLNFPTTINLQLDSSQMLRLLNEAFESGYEQAIKEIKEYLE